MRRILISGATGLVGRALSRRLTSAGYSVTRLVRPGTRLQTGDVAWDPNSAAADVQAMESFDAMVNLNGASIAGKRWTRARKAELRASRIEATRLLVDCLSKLERKPSVLVSASGAGFYGDRGDETLTEESDGGGGFLAMLARNWEAEAKRAESEGIRTVLLRSGVIFSSEGGALAQMARPFRMGVGGRLGSGKQWMPWISIEDVVGIVKSAIENETLRGPVNAVAPKPVQNEDFTRTIARLLRRPAIFPVPAFALKLLLGEMGEVLLLSSQRAIPKKLASAGYVFQYPEIESALKRALFGQ